MDWGMEQETVEQREDKEEQEVSKMGTKGRA